MPELFLRKVAHPQAAHNHHVVLIDGTEFEIGSIGVMHFSGTRSA